MAFREVARARQDARNTEIEASAASVAADITGAHMAVEGVLRQRPCNGRP
jgi:hypothetical protein